VRDGALYDDVRARQPDPLTLEPDLAEDQVARRRPDIDPDGPQAQALGGDVAVVLLVVVVVRVRVRQG
jgi:hypothetical protein